VEGPILDLRHCGSSILDKVEQTLITFRYHINDTHTFPENPYSKSSNLMPNVPPINNQFLPQHAPVLGTPTQYAQTAETSLVHAKNPLGLITGNFVDSPTLDTSIFSPSTQDQLPLQVSANDDLSDHRAWIEVSRLISWPAASILIALVSSLQVSGHYRPYLI
jgi:hypothetical protein